MSQKCVQAAWQSRAAVAAAEAQSQQLAQTQAELNALKARLWDSAARTAELEKCAFARSSCRSCAYTCKDCCVHPLLYGRKHGQMAGRLW